MRRVDAQGRVAALALVLVACSVPSHAAEQATRDENGRSYTPQGEPTYRIADNGRVDWYTFNGFRRYHAECHVCHGPHGEGSTFAPSLLEPMKTMGYDAFRDIMAQGLRNVGPAQQRVMRPMAEDRNVMCYLEDIYVYLKARADGALGRLRPEVHQRKPDAATQHEAACFGRP